jgi:hypothetical protein
MRDLIPAMTAFILVMLSHVMAHAESQAGVAPGARVRLSLDGETFVGRLMSVDDRQLTLAPVGGSKELTFAVDEITESEVSVGEKSHWKTGALIGAGAGVGVGAATVALFHTAGYEESFTGASAVVIGTTGVVGAGIGSLVGMTVRSERWESFSLEHQVRIGLSFIGDRKYVSVAFRF